MKQKPTVAHVCVPYLRPTEAFIYDRVAHPARFRSIVVTNEPVMEREQFPHGEIFTLAERAAAARKADTAAARATGVSPFYSGTLKSERVDVIHAHYGQVGCSVLKLKEKRGLPLMTSFYGHDASAALRDARAMKSYRKLFAGCEMISALSLDMKRALVEAGCAEEKIAVHHLAVDTDAVKPREAEPAGAELRILFAGRMVEKKGVSHLLGAFARALAKGARARLLIAGDGPLRADAEAAARRLGVDGKTDFLGMKKRAEVLALMREAHVFAIHSITASDGDREGTPTVLIEAGAVGLPCVSTLHAGIPEVIDDGATGLLAAEGDEEAFGDALHRLCADPELRAAMGRAARGKMEREFSLKSVIESIESDYLKLID